MISVTSLFVGNLKNKPVPVLQMKKAKTQLYMLL